jgi:hypothetical protein
MTDRIATVVHRFSKSKLAFPNISAGFLLSRNLVASLSERLKKVQRRKKFKEDFVYEFSMDAVYELSQAIK